MSSMSLFSILVVSTCANIELKEKSNRPIFPWSKQKGFRFTTDRHDEDNDDKEAAYSRYHLTPSSQRESTRLLKKRWLKTERRTEFIQEQRDTGRKDLKLLD